MAKIDRPVNFKASESLEDVMSKVILRLDKEKSKVLRACIVLGLPQVLAHPDLVDSLGDGETDVSNIAALLD